jgi:leucyl-tRNA synthetase
MAKNLERFYALAEEIIAMPDVEPRSLTLPDRWMLSRLQEHIEATTKALEAFETRRAVQHAFFLLMNDLHRYMKRAERADSRAYVLKRVLEVWLRLLAPFTPHVCEELWHRMDLPGFVSIAEWPVVDERFVDKKAEFIEDYIARVVDDIAEIQRAIGAGKLSRICLYVAQDWKRRVYRMALERAAAGKLEVGELIKTAIRELEPKPPASDLASYVQLVVKELRAMPADRLKILGSVEIDELQVLREAADFIGKQFGVSEVNVFRADDPARYDPRGRSKLAVPMRPAIFVE